MKYEMTTVQLLRQVSNLAEKHANSKLVSANLTTSQSELLMILFYSPEHTCSCSELGGRLKIAQSTCFGIVSRLEEKELVSSCIPKWNRRIKLVSLTEPGLERCSAIRKKLESVEEWLLDSLSEGEKGELFHLLDRIRKNR